jgi:hypothetical protein
VGKTWIQDITDLKKKTTNSYQSWSGTGFMLSSYLFDPVNQRLWINPQPFGSGAKQLQVQFPIFFLLKC